jgi:hypothetical protein
LRPQYILRHSWPEIFGALLLHSRNPTQNLHGSGPISASHSEFLPVQSAVLTMDRGALLAAAVAGAWRSSPPPISLMGEAVESIRSNILQSASAGLVWWKMRSSNLEGSAFAGELHDVARARALRAAIHEANLVLIFSRLRSEGIEPILAKGWAVSRLYPHPAIRPYGDHDLCVSADAVAKAKAVVESLRRPGLDVDFHIRFREIDADYSVLFSRSQQIPLGGSEIRVLGTEDHFQLLCVHTLYHGAWKPVWLCDVALMLESEGADLDWEVLHQRAGFRSEWILGAAFLARDVLGAELAGPIEAAVARQQFPSWLRDGLLSQWGKGRHYMTGPAVQDRVHENGLLQSLLERWPNPVQATVRMGAGLNRWPRLPFQVADVLRRGARVLNARRRSKS